MDWGKCLMIGFSGLEPSKDFLNFISNEKIGSVILFSENYESKKQLADLTKELKSKNKDLLIAVDQEGGRVVRFKNEFSFMPSFKEIADSGKPEFAYEIGKQIGSELAEVGVDWNLSPVLDVNTNPKNPVIGNRSFGNDPKTVADFAVQMMKGLHEGGVLSCGKHFPGHGDAILDSHLALPIIDNDKNRWEEIDLLPFRIAIENKIPAIMTAHLVAKAFDEVPASISKKIITDLLRKKMGFEGIVISDDLNMKGISGQMSVEEAALKAISAGSDMIIIRSDFKLQMSVLKELNKLPNFYSDCINKHLKVIRQ